ncbi:hypothetical protein FB446DRAFT_794680 [Lentinula raphanica]|nr:hypothetical protein FB446DRAFT_794680 [Lentinula raphanica]
MAEPTLSWRLFSSMAFERLSASLSIFPTLLLLPCSHLPSSPLTSQCYGTHGMTSRTANCDGGALEMTRDDLGGLETARTRSASPYLNQTIVNSRRRIGLPRMPSGSQPPQQPGSVPPLRAKTSAPPFFVSHPWSQRVNVILGIPLFCSPLHQLVLIDVGSSAARLVIWNDEEHLGTLSWC